MHIEMVRPFQGHKALRKTENHERFQVGLLLFTLILLAATITISSYTFARDIDIAMTFTGPKKRASQFAHSAVTSISTECSEIGKHFLKGGGNAVDAAVATVFCMGILRPQSSGLGGGGVMIFYKKESRKFYAYDYRETAPGNATYDLFERYSTASSKTGGMSIAVPGELRGLYTAWKEHGSLPWRNLLAPAIKFAREGFPLSNSTAQAVQTVKRVFGMNRTENIRQLFTGMDGHEYQTGDLFKNPALADTLERIQDDPESFYNGELAHKIVHDIQQHGGIITFDDFRNYRVMKRDCILLNITGNLTMASVGPPSSGILVLAIINILNGYNFTTNDKASIDWKVEVYHNFMEAAKFVFGQRGNLGDPEFMNESELHQVLSELTDPKSGEAFRQKILDYAVPDDSYYGESIGREDHGTSHISILAENGDAVSVTDSINFYFGSLRYSSSTGVVFNNAMDDFSVHNRTNLYHLAHSEANTIAPGKRPLMSMSPVIIVDENGEVKMVVGASGGPRIIAAVAQTILKTLYLGEELGDAIIKERLHTQLDPNIIEYYKGAPFDDAILNGLRRRGHTVIGKPWKGVVEAILRTPDWIYAMCDPSREGEPVGY